MRGGLHPVVERAAGGLLPAWAEATPSRQAHMARVAELLSSWAGPLRLSPVDRARWAAAAYLHDALRNADSEDLRSQVGPEAAPLPGPLLHGPAAARLLWREGVRDAELLRAVAYHTLGHAQLGLLGRALYAADFLEPGRDLLNEWRAALRTRMPDGLTEVTRDVLGARISYLVERGSPLRAETVGFWNTLALEVARGR